MPRRIFSNSRSGITTKKEIGKKKARANMTRRTSLVAAPNQKTDSAPFIVIKRRRKKEKEISRPFTSLP
ncbi:MAG: hypothetical protein ABJU84_19890 [Cyclobacteriaceae bacterium]